MKTTKKTSSKGIILKKKRDRLFDLLSHRNRIFFPFKKKVLFYARYAKNNHKSRGQRDKSITELPVRPEAASKLVNLFHVERKYVVLVFLTTYLPYFSDTYNPAMTMKIMLILAIIVATAAGKNSDYRRTLLDSVSPAKKEPFVIH